MGLQENQENEIADLAELYDIDVANDGAPDFPADCNVAQESCSRIGVQTIRRYVSALTNLWSIQVAQQVNSSPSPRNALVRNFISALEREQVQRGHESHQTRGIVLIYVYILHSGYTA